jgi:hypothetical protein
MFVTFALFEWYWRQPNVFPVVWPVVPGVNFAHVAMQCAVASAALAPPYCALAPVQFAVMSVQ